MTPELIALIEKTSGVVMTPQQEAEQRRSFAYGNTKIENERITRQMVAEADLKLNGPDRYGAPMPHVTYDPRTDTLYVSYDIRLSAQKSIESPAGVTRRYNDSNDLIGVTVLDFTHRLIGGDAVLGAASSRLTKDGQ